MAEEEFIDMPEDVGLFSISVDGAALDDDPQAWESFTKAMITSFNALGGLIALLGTAEDYSAITDTREMYTLPAPDFVMVDKDLVEPEEEKNLANLFEHHGETGSGYWYRRGLDYEDGLDERNYPSFRSALEGIWGRDPRLNGGRAVVPLEEVEV